MKLPLGTAFLLLTAMILSACQPSSETPGLPEADLLQPGDTIGAMRVVTSKPEDVSRTIFDYCDPYLGSQSVTLSFECQTPKTDFLFIG